MRIAVDFDDTLFIGGHANEELFQWLKDQQMSGSKVALWTCRTGESLERAVTFCEAQGLSFDYVHEGKILADVYIDDKAQKPSEVVHRTVNRRMSRVRQK